MSSCSIHTSSSAFSSNSMRFGWLKIKNRRLLTLSSLKKPRLRLRHGNRTPAGSPHRFFPIPLRPLFRVCDGSRCSSRANKATLNLSTLRLKAPPPLHRRLRQTMSRTLRHGACGLPYPLMYPRLHAVISSSSGRRGSNPSHGGPEGAESGGL